MSQVYTLLDLGFQVPLFTLMIIFGITSAVWDFYVEMSGQNSVALKQLLLLYMENFMESFIF